MLNLFSLRTNNWRNGTQWMGKWTARVIGENNYEYFRLEKRIAYAKYYYTKQAILTQMSLETPDVVNTFSVLAKEDTSHGFPVWRPLDPRLPRIGELYPNSAIPSGTYRCKVVLSFFGHLFI